MKRCTHKASDVVIWCPNCGPYPIIEGQERRIAGRVEREGDGEAEFFHWPCHPREQETVKLKIGDKLYFGDDGAPEFVIRRNVTLTVNYSGTAFAMSGEDKMLGLNEFAQRTENQ